MRTKTSLLFFVLTLTSVLAKAPSDVKVIVKNLDITVEVRKINLFKEDCFMTEKTVIKKFHERKKL